MILDHLDLVVRLAAERGGFGDLLRAAHDRARARDAILQATRDAGSAVDLSASLRDAESLPTAEMRCRRYLAIAGRLSAPGARETGRVLRVALQHWTEMAADDGWKEAHGRKLALLAVRMRNCDVLRGLVPALGKLEASSILVGVIAEMAQALTVCGDAAAAGEAVDIGMAMKRGARRSLDPGRDLRLRCAPRDDICRQRRGRVGPGVALGVFRSQFHRGSGRSTSKRLCWPSLSAAAAVSEMDIVIAAWSLVKRLAGNTASSVGKSAEAARRLGGNDSARELALAILGYAVEHSGTFEGLERLRLPSALSEAAEAYAMLGRTEESRLLSDKAWDLVKEQARSEVSEKEDRHPLLVILFSQRDAAVEVAQVRRRMGQREALVAARDLLFDLWGAERSESELRRLAEIMARNGDREDAAELNAALAGSQPDELLSRKCEILVEVVKRMAGAGRTAEAGQLAERLYELASDGRDIDLVRTVLQGVRFSGGIEIIERAITLAETTVRATSDRGSRGRCWRNSRGCTWLRATTNRRLTPSAGSARRSAGT